MRQGAPSKVRAARQSIAVPSFATLPTCDAANESRVYFVVDETASSSEARGSAPAVA